MRDAIDVAGTLRDGLRRAIDPLVVVSSLAATIAAALATLALHQIGLVVTAGPTHAISNFGVALATSALTLAPTSIGHAFASYAILRREDGLEASFATVWRGSAARWMAVYGGQVLTSLALGVGAAACFFPALYVAVVLSVITPVIVAESEGPVGGVSRCRALMAGRVGSVAAVVLATVLLMGLIVVLAELPLTLPAIGVGGVREAIGVLRTIATSDAPGVLGILVVTRTIYGALWSGVSTVLYLRLRAREMASVGETMARVFE